MDNRHHDAAYAWTVEALCVFILAVILFAGLWPFHSPKNEVNWLKNENGLDFGRHGSIVSSRTFPANGEQVDTSCSLEIWLRPRQIDETHTILAFDSAGNSRVLFLLRQYLGGLVMQRHIVNQQDDARTNTFGVKSVFRERESVVVTVTSGANNASVYVDGVLTDVSPSFRFSRKDLTGQLVVANSTRNDSWSGQFLRLAIYNQQLTPAQVVEHYTSWARSQLPTVAENEGLWALYLFNERKGNIAHDQLDHAPDLVIPEYYFVLHPPVLQFPWREYRPSWSYWKDVSINIVGFTPLGFVFGTYLSTVRKVNRPVMTAVMVGFLLSVTIEALQVFLPTRSSSMTDVVTNTLGTAIGAVSCRCSVVQGFLIAAGCCDVSCPAEFGLDPCGTRVQIAEGPNGENQS